MATIKRFEDLDCWKDARSFVGIVYRLTKNKPFNKDFDLISQIRRSSVSSMANTAEGFHRSSVAETISHAYVALDQNYISENEMNELILSGNTVWKKINGMISYLKRSQRTN